MFKRLSLAILGLSVTTAPALAHLNPAEHGSFMAGASHPVFGADHILAMVAVGLWAAQIGGKARLIVPAAFVSVMMAGYVLALYGVTLPFVEPAILASVIGLGLLVALAAKPPVWASAGAVSLFALFHGSAHGGELGSAAGLTFGLGFALTTALLHVGGIGLGTLASRHAGTLTRILGLATALGGGYLAFA